MTDKRDRATLFRTRLAQAMADRGRTQADLARLVRVDRSTVSQVLTAGSKRLPNAQVAAECAAALGVSADWLLGLTDLPDRAADLAVPLLPDAPRALIDDRLFGWHAEAAGSKVRHVAAHLPDLIKTPEVMEWEYAGQLGADPGAAIAAATGRIAEILSGRSDLEIAVPVDEIEALARGEGYYSGLPAAAARGQIAYLADLAARLFPTLRVSLFDGRRLYSAPVTVFGSRLAAVYLGQSWLTFRDGGSVAAFAAHVDGLVREALVGDRALPGWLRAL